MALTGAECEGKGYAEGARRGESGPDRHRRFDRSVEPTLPLQFGGNGCDPTRPWWLDMRHVGSRQRDARRRRVLVGGEGDDGLITFDATNHDLTIDGEGQGETAGVVGVIADEIDPARCPDLH